MQTALKKERNYGFQKGISGNPGGRPTVPEHLKGVRALTRTEIRYLVSKYGRLTLTELIKLMDKTQLPVIDHAICLFFREAIMQVDYTKLNFLLDRAIGKPQAPYDAPEEEDYANQERALSKMSIQELLQVVKETIPEAQKLINLDIK